MPPLTGNESGTNVAIGALNAFNLVMGLYAIDANMTISRFMHLFDKVPIGTIPIPIPYDGVPIVLGVIPLIFSVAVFVLPIVRGLVRPLREKKVAHENGRLALLREVLMRIEKHAPLTEPALTDAWKKAAGAAPLPTELTRAVVELGGDVDMQASEKNGDIRYRFVDLETEAVALEEERTLASEEEAKVGKVIFGSDS